MSSAMMKTMFGRRRFWGPLRRARASDMEPSAAARSICRREMCGDMAGSLHAVTLHRFVNPLDSGSRTIWNDGVAVAGLDRVFQHGCSPVDVFKPMTRRRHREQMCTEFGIQMR